MQLFQGMSNEFIELAMGNYLRDILIKSFTTQIGYRPSESEANSWENSLKAMADVVYEASLGDTGIIVEFRLPYSNRRIDVMLIGENSEKENAVIVELKQWDKAWCKGIIDIVELRPGEEELHPSAQARGYAEYLRDNQTVFYESEENPNPVNLEACSFLHNAKSHSCGDLLTDFYSDLLIDYPLFTRDLKEKFEEYLSDRLYKGNGSKVLNRIASSKFRPSKKLLENTAEIIQGNPVFTLLDEQKVAFNIVLSKAKESKTSGRKTVVIVTGGPGTGKSVIAVQLLAELAREGFNVIHCTGSTAFTTNLRAKVGRKSSALFRYTDSFTEAEENHFDTLIADEAHRIRETSNSRYTRTSRRSIKPQIEELIDVAKVSIFLLDSNQVVRPYEVGTPELIEKFARKKEVDLFKINLTTQFRCSGSQAYINWLDYVLNLGDENDLSWLRTKEYEFKIFDSPLELELKIRRDFKEGNTARIVAGFCWNWSKPNPDRSLVKDVKIGSWERPWNRKREGNTIPENDPYTIWATRDEGLNQIGCIYSAQGFEFDYCGVIFGNDIIWDESKGEWKGIKENSYDSVVKKEKNDFERLILNTYKVLLSRGMKGTYVYFLDPATRKHFEEMLKE